MLEKVKMMVTKDLMTLFCNPRSVQY